MKGIKKQCYYLLSPATIATATDYHYRHVYHLNHSYTTPTYPKKKKSLIDEKSKIAK